MVLRSRLFTTDSMETIEFRQEDILNHSQRHNLAHKKGGLQCGDETILVKQRSVVKELMSQLGHNIIKGKNLTSISLPVKMFEPRSFLQKVTDTMAYFPEYVTRAAKADPVERLRLLATAFLAGLHLSFTWEKPFNPILGETFHGRYPDGTNVYCEQVSHHPPQTAFLVVAPNEEYTFSGVNEPAVSFRVNCLKNKSQGDKRFRFADGSEVQLLHPDYKMSNILYGDLRGEVSGNAYLIDEEHKLRVVLRFGEQNDLPSDAFFGALERLIPIESEGREGGGRITDRSSSASRIASNSKPSRRFFSRIRSPRQSSSGGRTDMTRDDLNWEEISTFKGSWLSHVEVDGEDRWEMSKEISHELMPVNPPLPSDSRMRIDLQSVRRGWTSEAQKNKDRLEKLQRQDAKLRKKRAESR